MYQNPNSKIQELYETFRKEPDCKQMILEYTFSRKWLLRELEHMTQEQSDAVYNYIGMLLDIHERLMIFALQKNTPGS